jgi:hypothetical protein
MAVVGFPLRGLAWPLGPGRDSLGYLAYYYDFNRPEPYDALFMILRTPLPSFFFTPLLEKFGAVFVEGLLFGLYAVCLLALFYIGKTWSRTVGYLVVALCTLQFGWGSLFHVVSSDSLTGALTILVFWGFLFSLLRDRPLLALFAGICAGLLFLSRPSNQLYIFLALAPFLLRKTWLRKLAIAAAFVAGMAPFLLGWAWYNQKTYGAFTLARATYLINPIWRLWITDQIVKPDNGPASQRLAREIQDRILSQPPHAQKGVTVEEYFASPAYNQKMPELMAMIDEVWGRDSNYSILRDVSLEAIGRYPGRYAQGVALNFLQTFFINYKHPVPLRGGASVYTHKQGVAFMGPDISDHFVPLAEVNLDSVRNSEEYEDFLRKKHPSILRAYQLQQSELPPRSGLVSWGTFLNFVAQFFVPMPFWLGLYLLGVFRGWPWTNQDRFLLFFLAFALGHILAGSLSIHTVIYQYRLFFDPFFLLGGAVGLKYLVRKMEAGAGAKA